MRHPMMELVAPVRGRLAAGVLLAALSSLCALVPLVSVAGIGRELLGAGSARVVWCWAAAGVAGAVARIALHGTATSLCHYADADFRASVRGRLVKHLGTVPLGWFARNGSGEVKKAVTDDVRRMHVVVAHLAADLTSGIVTPVVGVLLLAVVDWRLTLSLVLYLVVVGSATLPASVKSMAEYYDDYDAAVSETARATVELVDGIEVVKTFGAGARQTSRFHTSVDRWVEICLAWTRAGSRPASLFGVFTTPAAMTAWILLTGLASVALGWSEPWAVLPFLLVGVGVPGAFQQLGAMTSSIRQAGAAARHVAEVLDEPPLAAPSHPQSPVGARVELRGVTFAYEPGATPALDDVDLVLEPGTITALVGTSGSGKSTVARLIPRFFDVDSGTVLLGGVDVREIRQSELLRSVAIVFQNAVLVAGTIRENIRLGRPEATDAEVEAAAAAAHLDGLLAGLPAGLDTVVGGGGSGLSGGERQRVTIARAILQDAPVVVLDEATAHADPHSEVEIQRALATLARGRTVLVIAHRLATVRDADQIVVLERGRVLERGTHDSLVVAGGRYHSLVMAQQTSDDTLGARS